MKHTQDFGNNKGSLLLLVLGILALLSMLGTALLLISRQEERASGEFMDSTRAAFAAESGMEYAVGKILEFKESPIFFPKYMGQYPAINPSNIQHATGSSFASIDSNEDGDLDAAGSISETYRKNGDYFRLLVSSCTGKLNINDTDSPYNVDTDPFDDQMVPERDYAAIPVHMRHPSGKDPDWSYPPSWFGQYNPDVNGDGSIDQQDRDFVLWVFSHPGEATEAQIQAADLDGNGFVNIFDANTVSAAIIESTENGGSYAPPQNLIGKPYPKAERRLTRILMELINNLFPYNAGLPTGPGNRPELGKEIANLLMSARESRFHGSYSSYDQIYDLLVPKHLTGSQYQRFEKEITLSSWQDQNVLRPSFQWKVSTPPRTDPNDPSSAHLKYWAGDYPIHSWLPMVLGAANTPIPMPKPSGGILEPITYDFDFDGVLEAHESVRHDHDIYMYSDMQTKFFELERRSPVNINEASLSLLKALIAPIQGWYLKEAPSVWEGEDPRSRAEDWSQPGRTASDLPFSNPGSFPWLVNPAMLNLSYDTVLDREAFWIGTFPIADGNQYYFADAYSMNYWHYNHTTSAPEVQYPMKSKRFGELTQSKAFQAQIVEKLAQRIYGRIHVDSNNDGIDEEFHPISTWQEFESLILEWADPDSGNHLTGNPKDFDIYMAHALIANFNPNSRINDYNPNKTIYLHVDKSQLISNTTEFCFHPMGEFDISSYGAINDSRGKTKSSNLLRTLIRPFEVLRITSQSQFMKGYTGEVTMFDFFSKSMGVMDTAHALEGLIPGLAWQGKSIQSYPEPERGHRINGTFHQADAVEQIKDSVFDGFLMLAVNKPHATELFKPLSQALWYSSFFGMLHAHFPTQQAFTQEKIQTAKSDEGDEKWILQQGRYGTMPSDTLMLFEPNCYVPANRPKTHEIDAFFGSPVQGSKIPLYKTVGSDPEFTPSCLLPDGALSDTGRGLKYFFHAGTLWNQIRPGKGTIQFWIKPNFDVAHSNRIRNLFSLEYGNSSMADFGYPGSNEFKVFSLNYFSRGGSRVPLNSDGRLEDKYSTSYSFQHSLNDGLWLPTRSMLLCFGNAHEGTPNSLSYPFKLGSPSVNQSWRKDCGSEKPEGDKHFNFESHQWSHVAFTWQCYIRTMADGLYQFPLGSNLELVINGQYVDQDHAEGPGLPVTSSSADYWRSMHNFPLPPISGQEKQYMTFGSTSSSDYLNNVSDSTYGHISTCSSFLEPYALVDEFSYGRYYNEEDAVYTSPEIKLFSELDTSAESLRLMSIAWTGYTPKPPADDLTVFPANHPSFNDNLSASNANEYTEVKFKSASAGFSFWPNQEIRSEAFSVDICKAQTAEGWQYESRGINPEDMPNFPGGSVDPSWATAPELVWKRDNDAMRFKVHFNLVGGQTLFTSPVFDDITFLFAPNRPKILFWWKGQ